MAEKKRCPFCGDRFTPNPRTRHCQIACAKLACQKKRKQQADAAWRRNNPGWFEGRRAKVREWAAVYPDYWKDWRASNPAYRTRERDRMRRNRVLRVAKQDAIRENPLGYLSKIRSQARKSVAKQDAIAIQLDGIFDYLLLAGPVAKPNDMAPATPGPLSSLP